MRDPPSSPRRLLVPALAITTVVLVAAGALAHGAGGAQGAAEAAQLPAWVTWAAGAGVVALSFALVGLFLTRDTEPTPVSARPVEPGDVTGLPRGLVGLARLVGLLLLVAVVAATIVPWDPGDGARWLVWGLLWGVLPILAYTVGNLWLVASPFRALAGLAERLRGEGRRLAYPERLGAWPSVVLLLGLIVFELLEPSSDWLGRVAIVYTTFTLVGMATFGSRAWLARVEVFDRVFTWWSALAPARLTREGLTWQAPGADATDRRAAGLGDAAFLIALLYGTNADGFLATGLGAGVVDRLAALGTPTAAVLVTLAGYAAFLYVFWACAWLIHHVTDTTASRSETASVFAVTLVPIAIGYHLAHNLAYAVDNLPLIVDALADPLGLTAGAASPWTFLSSRGELLVGLQIALVVLGHVAAVLLAHRRAFTAFPSKVQAVKSELGLTAAMLVYTLASLWIVTAAHTGGVAG